MNGMRLSLPVRSNSVYAHLISMTPVTSELIPADAVEPAFSFKHGADVAPLMTDPTPLLTPLPGPAPQGPLWPYVRSISRPSTAFVRPTENVKSGRKRVRAYHSRSPSRE